MSRTKETKEFREWAEPQVKPDIDEGLGDKRKEAKEAIRRTIEQMTRPQKDELDEIISYFEENIKFDPPKGRYGIGADMPDTELYIGDKEAARGFLLDKMRELLRRVLFDVENKKR